MANRHAASRSNLLSLRLLTDAGSQRKGARCLDGSPGGYYFRPGIGESAHRFLVILVGSGWCNSLSSCVARSRTAIGSSEHWESHVHGYGIANASSQANPDFRDWSVAYVGACDGAFFLGDLPTPTTTHGLHFRGRAIVDAVIADLIRREGLSSARRVVVTGESSGGLGAALSVDRIAAMLPSVDVRAIVDGGFFLDRPWCGGDVDSLRPIIELSGMNSSLRLAGGCNTSGSTTTTTTTAPRDLWRCASLPHALPHIRSPLFLTQSAYDYTQLGEGGEGIGCTPPLTVNSSSLPACNASGMARFEAFGDAMAAQLDRALRRHNTNGLHSNVSSSSSNGGARVGHRGYFVIGCIAHGLTQYGRFLSNGGHGTNNGTELSLWANPNWEVPARSGRSVASAVGDWYFARSREVAHEDIGAWPQNRPCAWLGLP